MDYNGLTRIPNFVKSVCLDYGQNAITEEEFINCMQFLVTNEIIVLPVPKPTATNVSETTTIGLSDKIPVQDT